MIRTRVTVEAHPDATESIATLAVAAYPNETGGLLLGWWDLGQVVVRYAVEVPDPGATSHSWSRDQVRAQATLDDAMTEYAHPWLGYVGDWHSHPAPQGRSGQDLGSIRRASRQYVEPLVLMVHRSDGIIEYDAARRGHPQQVTVIAPPTEGLAES